MKLFLLVCFALSVGSAPVEDLPASPGITVSSVDLKKPNEIPKSDDAKMQDSKPAAPAQDIKTRKDVENGTSGDGTKEDVDKRFLLPGFGVGGVGGVGFGGYRGLHATHGTYANFANIGNFGSYGTHVGGYGGYGIGGGVPVGLPGTYFG